MSRKDKLTQDVTLWRTIVLATAAAIITLGNYLFAEVKAGTAIAADFIVGSVLLAFLLVFIVGAWNKMQAYGDELEKEE